MKYCTLLLLAIATCLPCHARETGHPVSGHVTDNITGTGVAALMTLMTDDSTVVDTTTARLYDDVYSGRKGAYYEFKKGVSKVGRYIVRAEAEGYETAYTRFRLASNRERDVQLQEILMSRVWQQLPEVTVQATKVKMVMHGDTIVYNADAFNLAEGSMLDALISKLPGTRLTKDGKIYVNGRYVESLLVNGQDFFNGNAQLALQNLPAYTVNKIKVYDKAGQASEMMGRDMGDKQYVMDVRLKKEYAQGCMGNAEADGGTKDRYQLRGFGMKFSESSRLFAYANLNNLNENSMPDLSGEWNPQDVPQGLLATKTGGIGYTKSFNGSKWTKWFTASAIYTHTDGDNETRESRQTFLPGGDTFARSLSALKSCSDRWQNDESVSWTVPGFSTFDWLRLTYDRRKGWNNGTEEVNVNDEEPDAMRDNPSLYTLNSSLTQGYSDAKDFNMSLKSDNAIRVFAVDMVRIGLDAKYNRLKQHSFSVDDVQYANNASARDYRNNYTDAPHQDWNVAASADYNYVWHDFTIDPGYTYTYSYNKTSNMLYRLDKLAGRDSSRFDMLPSARETLRDVVDGNNSYWFREYRNEHKANIKLRGKWKLLGAETTVNLPLRSVSANLYYHRPDQHDVSRNATFFEPDIEMVHWGDKASWNFSAGMKSDLPDLTTTVDYRDDSDPLNIRLGNPALKNVHRYNADGNISFNGGHQRVLRFSAGWHKTDNAVAYGLTFDRRTGVSTTRPASVNGNWDANGGIGFARAFGKDDKFSTDNDLTVNYNHNVDLATSFENTEGSMDGKEPALYSPQRSIVRNWRVGGNIKFNYRPNEQYEFTVHGGGTYNIIRSHREGFEDIDAGDYNVGFNAVLNLPWKLQATTDMTMFARRGWQQDEMNTTDWVWNAQLSRSFCNGKLVAKLQGFDILHQLSTTQYTVNEQGRTETWHNSIPRYAMISISWRFDHNPKNIETGFGY